MTKPLAVVLVSILLASVRLIAGEPDESPFDAKALWAKVVAATSAISVADDPQQHWLEVNARCQRVYDAVEESKDLRAQRDVIDYYVDQFGKHGPEADVRWIFAFGEELLQRDLNPVRDAKREAEEFKYAFHMNFDRNVLSPALLARSSRDAKFRARYWHALAYANPRMIEQGAVEFVIQTSVPRVFAADGVDKDGLLSHHLFNTTLVMHALGRDDLADGIDFKNSVARLNELQAWGKENLFKLQPSKKQPTWIIDKTLRKGTEEFQWPLPQLRAPELPFPDWDKKLTAPLPGVFRL